MSSTLFLVTLFVAFAGVLSEDDFLAETMRIEEQCRNETGVNKLSPENMTNMASLPEEAKCFLACVAQKRGMLSKDGVNWKKIVEDEKKFIEKLAEKNNSTDLKMMSENEIKILETCAKELKVIEDNMCETQYQFLLCCEKAANDKKAK